MFQLQGYIGVFSGIFFYLLCVNIPHVSLALPFFTNQLFNMYGLITQKLCTQ